jgi:hypothetical protein
MLGLAGIWGGGGALFAASPESVVSDDELARQGIYLPYRFTNPATPPTHTLAAAEAEAALQRDWLFQAEGKSLEQRTADEIGWARQLAARLARNPLTPDLKPELAELDPWPTPGNPLPTTDKATCSP